MYAHQVIAISIALILGVSGANAADETSSEQLITVNISGETLATDPVRCQRRMGNKSIRPTTSIAIGSQRNSA